MTNNGKHAESHHHRHVEMTATSPTGKKKKKIQDRHDSSALLTAERHNSGVAYRSVVHSDANGMVDWAINVMLVLSACHPQRERLAEKGPSFSLAPQTGTVSHLTFIP